MQFNGKLRYENQIRFDKNIVTAVDTVFARFKTGDPSARNLVLDMVKPGVRVIEDMTSIRLECALEPDAKDLKFNLVAPPSDWLIADRNAPQAAWLVRIIYSSDYTQVRWRGSAEGSATFSALTPDQVQFEGILTIDADVANGNSSDWIPTAFRSWRYIAFWPSENAARDFGNGMRKALNRAYYEYLSNRFGLTITSDFRGKDEL